MTNIRYVYLGLKHPFYALVYAAKGPYVLCKIHNIIFGHGKPPPRFKTALFLSAGFLK